MNYNHVTLAGNLTRDPELKYTPKGTAICAFTIAINRKWKSDSGEEKESVAFIDHKAFGKTGEAIAKYLKKGQPIFTVGRLDQENWDDKATGQKRSKLVVVVESFQFVGGREQGAKTQVEAPKKVAPAANANEPETWGDDEPPF